MLRIPGQPPDFGFGRFGPGVVYDPATLMAGSMAASAIGGGISAGGSLASGSYAAKAGQAQMAGANYEAAQLDQNASQAIASSQRQMLDTQQRTNLAVSSAPARAGASGVAADTGSPLANTGAIAQRGSYQALMDMFNGQSKATGLENEAQGIRYTGQLDEIAGAEKERASYLAAGGDVAGAAGSMMSSYGRYAYPMRNNTYGQM